MRALITGDQGFVGRHVTRALRARGYETVGFDIKRGPEQDVRGWFRGDDVPWCDLVVHCAAIVGGRATIDGAPLRVAVDLSIDAEFFNWCLRSRPRRVVYFSSSAAYPVGLQASYGRPLAEDDIDLDNVRQPDAIYGWVKLTGERLAREAAKSGLPVTVVRPFTGYGEDQDLDYPFPRFIQRARELDDPFIVWGDGHQQRDFIHIDDVVDAMLAIIDADESGPVNIGTGVGTSFMTLAAMVTAIASYTPAIIPDRTKPVGVYKRVANVRRLHQFWNVDGFIPLHEGIERALCLTSP